MKKFFIIPIVICLFITGVIYFNFSLFNPYNTEIFHPIFATLLPLTILLLLASFLKNTRPKFVFWTILVFLVLDFLALSQIDPLCSGIVCYDRTQSALIFSSLFSFVYFVVLFVQNQKHH